MGSTTRFVTAIATSLTFSFIFPVFVAADHASHVEVEPWEHAIQDKNLLDKMYRSDKVSDLLFQALDDVELYEGDFGGVNLEVEVGRRVFDNRDILGSWTVVDKFNVKGKIPIYTDELSSSLNSESVGFYLGTRAGLEFVNIRQILPKNYEDLPSTEEEVKRVKDSQWYKDFIKSQEGEGKKPESNKEAEGEWVYRKGLDGRPKLSFLPLPNDPENDARFSRLWNMLFFPFRLPTNKDNFDKMDKGEILSFTGEGMLELGASVGWSIDPSDILEGGGINASIITYLKGTYRFSVMKEDERFAQLKITRSFGKGKGGSIGARVDFEGINIVDDLFDTKIIPFNLSVRREVARSFDIGYRYDMENPDALKAYQEAVVGRTKRSEDLAKIENSGVTWSFKRTTDSKGTDIQSQLRLGFIYKRRGKTSIRTVESKITTPDGKFHFFKALTNNSREWKYFWGSYEKLHYNYVVNVDLGEYEKDPKCDTCLHFIAEGSLSDSHTRRKEMMKYILETEDNIGKFGVFPRPPAMDALTTNEGLIDAQGHYRRLPQNVEFGGEHFGKSSFFYRVNFSNAQIEKFIHTPKRKHWGMLEKAFGIPRGVWANFLSRFFYQFIRAPLTLLNIPLYAADIHIREGGLLPRATYVRQHWKKLQKEDKVKEKATRLGRLFMNRYYNYEAIRLLRGTLDGEKTAYTISANSRLFGNIWESGETALKFDNIATEIQKKIDFDSEGPRFPDGSNGTLPKNFKVKKKSNKEYEISFELAETPRALFVQVFNASKKYKMKDKLSDLLLYNNGQFKQGPNRFAYKVDEGDQNPWHPIFAKLVKGERYLYRAAVSFTGVNWGRAAQAEFKN